MKYKYSHPEFFEDWEDFEKCKHNGNIVLYGAGRRGSVAAHCLNKKGIDFLCFCDGDKEKQGKKLLDHLIISPEQLVEKYQDSVIVVTTNHYYYISRELKKKNFKKIYSCVHLFSEIDFDGYELFSIEYMMRNIDQYFYSFVAENPSISYITQVQIPVTTRCTLNCKECDSYIPYVKYPEDFEYSTIVESVNKLLTAYDKIGNVLLYGGEPLLYDKLSLLVKEFSSNSKIEKVSIVTNGTLMFNEQLLNECKNKNVYIRISDYGRLSIKKNELISVLKTNEINVEVTDFKHWRTAPTVDCLNESPEELKIKVQNCCTIAGSTTIINGKLFFCSYSAFFDYYKAVPSFGDNYIDLCDDTIGKELREKIEIIRHMAIDGVPKKVCKYCNFNNYLDNLPVAEQTNEKRSFKKVY